MEPFYQVIEIIGLFVQLLGLFAFGIAAGWLTLRVIDQEEKVWQLQAIVYSLFLVFVALLARSLTPGALGIFLVGAAGALIFWGVIKKGEKPVKEK